jgi:hypothetical protein
MIRLLHYLGGAWVDGRGEGVVLRDPATQTPIASTSAEGNRSRWVTRLGASRRRCRATRDDVRAAW